MHEFESPDALAWAELQRRGSIRSRYIRGLEAEVAAELARCLDPYIFEQSVRPYGAIVARELPQLDRLGRLIDIDDLSPDVIRSLADGQTSFVLVVKGEPLRLVVMHGALDTDQDYASHAVWVDGVIICNDDEGIVRIVTDSSVTMVEGRRWIAKDLVFEAAEDILECVPASNPDVVRRLLELAHHRISPRGLGATLLYQLDERPRPTHRRDDGVALAKLGLSVLDSQDEALVLHQVRYRDGALLIDRGGVLVAANVILRPTKASERVVPSMGGTRHTSAARHTYDCPDVIAFVVSMDGPVTVFSDGQRIADLKSADPPVPPKTADRIAELYVIRRFENIQARNDATSF
jgi:DNA integrity scanning protein DisA with diadenylate cyclase activity